MHKKLTSPGSGGNDVAASLTTLSNASSNTASFMCLSIASTSPRIQVLPSLAVAKCPRMERGVG